MWVWGLCCRREGMSGVCSVSLSSSLHLTLSCTLFLPLPLFLSVSPSPWMTLAHFPSFRKGGSCLRSSLMGCFRRSFQFIYCLFYLSFISSTLGLPYARPFFPPLMPLFSDISTRCNPSEILFFPLYRFQNLLNAKYMSLYTYLTPSLYSCIPTFHSHLLILPHGSSHSINPLILVFSPLFSLLHLFPSFFNTFTLIYPRIPVLAFVESIYVYK